jgi:hypothetical protein
MIIPDPPIASPRLSIPLFAAAAGAAALGAVALYRRLTRKTALATVRVNGCMPRTTVVIESDGPERDPFQTEVPW